MKTRMMMLGAVLAVAAGSGAMAASSSVDRSFTATGENCLQVNWSQETLAKHPKIASACKAVLQRNGKYFVKFDAEVKKVADAGRQVTLDVANGDVITVTPREGAMVNINGKNTPVSKLRPGDSLTFYIPEDRFTTQLTPEPLAAAVPADEAPIIDEPPMQQMAMSEPTEMPRTASPLPLLGLAGLMLLIAGAGLTFHRRMRSH